MNNFSDIIGNEQIIKSIKQIIRNKMVSHAYIISGNEGSGKKLLANAIAKTLLCESEDDEPCDKCVSCRTYDEGNNPDVIYIYPMKENGKVLTVDDIKDQIVMTANIKPYNHKYKIYIIPDADKMRIEAQNKFLKTLEEPPEYVVFLLLTKNSNALLPTILSRCENFSMSLISSYRIKEYLEKNGFTNINTDIVAEYAQGSIGRAIKVAQSEDFANMRNELIETLSDIKNKPYYVLMENAKNLKADNEVDAIVEMVYLWLRDVLVYKITRNTEYIIEKDAVDYVVNEAKNNSYEVLCRIPELIAKTKRYLKLDVNAQVALEMLFINIKGELFNDRSSRSTI